MEDNDGHLHKYVRYAGLPWREARVRLSRVCFCPDEWRSFDPESDDSGLASLPSWSPPWHTHILLPHILIMTYKLDATMIVNSPYSACGEASSRVGVCF
jgi:hypothetical protein